MGIAVAARGAVVVDDRLRTGEPHVFAVGDVNGAVVDAETDKVLGVAILAHDAQEVVNTVALAMRTLRDGIWTHPSMTEALNDDLFGAL